MGFFSAAGETLFGTKTKKKAQASTERSEKKLDKVGEQADTLGTEYKNQANKLGGVADEYGKTIQENKDTANKYGKQADTYGAEGSKYGKQSDVYDEQTKQNLGTSAADYMAKQQSAAEAEAERQGQQAATQGTQAALRSARSSGLSKGQSALASAQQAGDIYSGAYNTGLESGKQNYTQGTQLQQSQGQALANRQQTAINAQNQAMGAQLSAQNNAIGAQNSQQNAYGNQLAAMGGQNNALNTKLGAATGQANIAQNQYQNAANKSAQTWGTIGTLASASAMMLSDENTKTNIIEKKPEDATKIEPLKVEAPAPVQSAPASANVANDTGFDKEKLASMLSNIGSVGSGINSSSPVTTTGINAARDTTEASRKQLNDSIMTIGSYMKDGPMKKINSILGSGGGGSELKTATSVSDANTAASAAGKTSAAPTAASKSALPIGKGAAAGASSGAAGGAGAAGGSGAAAAGGAAKVGFMAKLGPMIAALSDENTKTDIKGMKDALDKIDVKEIAKKIRPVSFEYKEGAENIDPNAKPHVEHVGVIAQDLEKTALAPAVKTGEDGYKRIDIAELTPAILNMVIQQQSQIEDYKKQVDELKKGMK